MICSANLARGEEHAYPLLGSVADILDGDSAPIGYQSTRSEMRSTSISSNDRLWMIDTRRISSNACQANLTNPTFEVSRIHCGGLTASTLEEFLATIANTQAAVVYVHGNRMERCESLHRGMSVYKETRRFSDCAPIDWVIWSWPSEQTGLLAKDARVKAQRTDAQGLYLAWLLRRHVELGTPTALIGYSFGGRVITGSLHALAGGALGGRTMPGPSIQGMRFDAGLVAPAIDSNWMTSRGYHRLATTNLDRLVVLYNQDDAVLKRYWLLDRVRGRFALGFTGPKVFAPRPDGTTISVRGRDCSSFLGLAHVELDYYQKSCRAGSEMANLIDDIHVTH